MFIGRSTVSFLANLIIRATTLVPLVVSSAFAGTTSYHIGNSLTWGSQPNGLAAMAIAAGKDHAVGYHIHTGWSISAIWNNPTEITKTNNFGGFSTALPNYVWDYVTLQPHHSNTTLASDRQRIIDFINLNEAGPSTTTNYYIYSAWPRPSSGDYKAFWTQSVSSASNQLTIHAREYFDHLYSAVTDVLGNTVPVHIIPVGEVLYQVDLLFESGAVPGFTDVSQLYIDDNHLGGDIGGWIVANTVYATLFKENPTGLQKPEGFYLPTAGGPSKLTDALNTRLQALVWDVVSHHPATGIDISPNIFTFTDATGVAVNTTRKSNKIQVTGINAATDISITNGEYSVNSGPFTTANGTVRSGDSVSVRLRSSVSYSTSAKAKLTIGDVSDTFTITTTPFSNPGSVSGVVFKDLNGGGVMSVGEPPIPGARLILRSTGLNGRFEKYGDDVFTNKWTDDSGAYVFSELLPGSYRLSLVQGANSSVPNDAVLTSRVATYNFILSGGENLLARNYGYIYPQDGSVSDVGIDIDPRGDRNILSITNVWAAILTNGDFDALQVDPDSPRFGHLQAAPIKTVVEDVDHDGDMDIRFKFIVNQTGIACGDTTATLTSNTFAGLQIKGTDSVKTNGCR